MYFPGAPSTVTAAKLPIVKKTTPTKKADNNGILIIHITF